MAIKRRRKDMAVPYPCEWPVVLRDILRKAWDEHYKENKITRKKKKIVFRSKLEATVAKLLPTEVVENYERDKIYYTVDHEYRPDFTVNEKLFIEVKGYFRAADRAKHLHIKKQHPELEVYFIFGDSKNKLNKSSHTTYADWCDKYHFKYTDVKNGIPAEWFTTKETN